MNEVLWIEQFGLNLCLEQYLTNQLLNQMDPLMALLMVATNLVCTISGSGGLSNIHDCEEE